MKSTREPAVSGRFYPDNPKELEKVVRSYIGEVQDAQKAIGVISPHAGFIYSGSVAGKTFATVEVPHSVLVLCPKHTLKGASTAIMDEGVWRMPSGDIPIDTKLAKHLLSELSDVVVDAEAHRYEHSLEVQLPFLRERRKNFHFVPLALAYRSYEDCLKLGNELGKALKKWKKPLLIVASSDMNHHETQKITIKKDMLAIERMLKFDSEGLYHVCEHEQITMCGVVPVIVLLVASQYLNANKIELIEHSTSADISGNYEQVVGYAGLVIR